MTQQKILSIDATVLNSIQSCARKTDYSFEQNIRLPNKAESLEKGDLMHKMLEVYYSLIGNRCARFESDIFTDLQSVGFQLPLQTESPHPIIQFAIESGRYFATKMELQTDEIESTIYQFHEYCKHYEQDSWLPLAVEEVGSIGLYEDEMYKIIYSCKTDLVAQKVDIIAPFDHKTSKRREEPSSLSNQFIGTCHVLGFNNIVINKIGFQKTLSPSERFQRYILTIDDKRIEEWKQNTIFWSFFHLMITAQDRKERIQAAQHMIDQLELTNIPMNLTSCDKYSGCIYSSLCESSPEGRNWKIERDYKKEKEWDVSAILEAK